MSKKRHSLKQASQRDRELQRFFDGELSPAEARRVYHGIAHDEEARIRLQVLSEMRDLLADDAEAVAAEADFSTLWDDIEHGIERGAAEPRPSLFAQGLFRWGMVTASAVAASVLALVLMWPGKASAPAQHNDCVIESLEVGQGATSTIFTIDDPELADATTVIWVNESQGD